MKRIQKSLFIGLMTLVGYACSESKQAIELRDYADLANPLTGTMSSFELSSGNTYPVISRPWGMNSWTPQTGKMGDGWQYTYTASQIRGFKQTHQPSPWINDYGQFSLMPTVGSEPLFDEEERASWFSHKAEEARPYAYEVYLADFDSEVSLSPSERGAVFEVKYSTMAKAEECWLVIDAFDQGGELRQIDDHQVLGISRKNSGGVPEGFANYFVLKTEVEIVEAKPYKREGHEMLALRFGFAEEGKHLRLWVASSFISPEQALRNLKEVEGRRYDELRAEGKAVWNDALGRIEAIDSEDKLRTFYSNLYRSLLFPRRFYELDAEGKPYHYSPYSGEIEEGYMYTDTGFWDTFRSLFPLINLLYPEEGSRMQEGLLNAYRESGFFPEWASPGHRDCMVGNNSASVLADAFLKGIGKVDTALLVKGLLHGAHSEHPQVRSTGRLAYVAYDSLGYVPTDIGIHESAARTLEYAYADWCIYQVLKATGAREELVNKYKERAKNYRHLFDPSTGWMRGRNADGSFQTPFSPYKWGDAFTEGNALHYTWSVFHDVDGLIKLMGGKESFVARLDSVFSLPPIFDNSYYGFTIHEIREMQIMNMGNYAHGNQPIQHMIYLYNYAGASHKAQYHIRRVMDKLYSSAPDGYCGDEDNGQTSAWYVFSALGFYPVTPASDEYVIGIPYLSDIRLKLPEGRTLRIKSSDIHKPYIQSVKRNGKAYEAPFLRFGDLLQGGELSFTLGDQPSGWGSRSKERPYSLSNEAETAQK